MPIPALIANLRSMNTYHGQRVAENLELDLPSQSSAHPAAGLYGNNVDPVVDAAFTHWVESLTAGPSLNELNHSTFFLLPHAGAKRPHFQTPNNEIKNRCNGRLNPPPVQFTRYISVKNFYYGLVQPRDRYNSQPPAQVVQKVRDYLNVIAPMASPDSLGTYWIARPFDDEALDPTNRERYPDPAWITPAESAPHNLMKQTKSPPSLPRKRPLRWSDSWPCPGSRRLLIWRVRGD